MTTSQYDSIISKQTGLPDYTQLADPSTPVYDPDGIFFKNALLKPDIEINLSGEESSIGIEFTGRLSIDNLKGFGNENEVDGNYIVLSAQ